ncbi:DJ-1/PfpI family protein [Hypoxylon sp. FL1857]|nr:DJ-1/PfpI family protein [Hypoxylon sp. FL1857]
MAPNILVVLTSHDKLGDSNKPTGWFLAKFSIQPESSHPWRYFNEVKASVAVASSAGGRAPLDPISAEVSKQDPLSTSFLEEQKALWENTSKLSSFLGKADKFDVIFFPGGHGPMYDLAGDAASQQLIAEFWEKGKIVAAVCHGSAALVNVKLLDGSLLLKGKTVTGFSNEEEDYAKLSQFMPFMLETKLDEASEGKFVKAEHQFGEKVAVDGRLITGQNPASAKGVAEAIIEALGVSAST